MLLEILDRHSSQAKQISQHHSFQKPGVDRLRFTIALNGPSVDYRRLLGNHDPLLLQNRSSRTEIAGGPLLDSEQELEFYQDKPFEFIESYRLYFEIDTHFFVHANYEAKRPLSDQDNSTLLWLSLSQKMPKRHRSKKMAIVGHTSQKSGEVLEWRHLKCIDTYCHGGG